MGCSFPIPIWTIADVGLGRTWLSLYRETDILTDLPGTSLNPIITGGSDTGSRRDMDGQDTHNDLIMGEIII